MVLDDEGERKVAMSGFSCKMRNQNWLRTYANATGRKASEVVDQAIDEMRAKYDIKVDMNMAEGKVVEMLLSIYEAQEQIQGIMQENEARARRRIAAHIESVRQSKEFRRNMIAEDSFKKGVEHFLIHEVCPDTGVRFDDAVIIFKKIWVMKEIESRGSSNQEGEQGA